MARIKRVRRSAATWRELFARQAGSGLSVPAFCREERINANVFRRWRSALKSADRGDPLTKRTVPSGALVAPFIDLGDLRSRDLRFEVRLELGAGIVLSIARS